MKMTKTVLVAMVAAALSAFAAETEDNTPLDTTGGKTLNVAAGDTLIYKGKISGNGLLTKIGEGTLVLDNAENDFTGGISVLTGYVNAAKSGCLGTGKVSVRNKDAGGIIFSAPNGEFFNAMGKYNQHGGFMTFKADTTLHGAIEATDSQTYMNADEGVKAVFKGDVNIKNKTMQLQNMKGIMVFEGKFISSAVKVGFSTYNPTTGNEGGQIIICNQENAVHLVQLGHVTYTCSNENVIVGAEVRTRYDTDTGRLDLNGFNQRIASIDVYTKSYAKSNNLTNSLILSERPATLTIEGTGAGGLAECNCLITGKVSLVMDADPAFTNIFLHRSNTTTGDITVRSGVFDLNGEKSHFANVPKISVESNGAFLLRTSAANALASVTNLTIASGGRFVVATGSTGTPVTPFADGLVNLDLASGSEFRLMPGNVVTAATLRVDGEYQHKGRYTNSECAAIKEGTVIVRSGPPRGFSILFR